VIHLPSEPLWDQGEYFFTESTVWWIDTANGRVTKLNLKYAGPIGKGIKKISVIVDHLSALEVFDLDFNDLSSLPSEIGNLPVLRNLLVGDNMLDSIPAQIGNLFSLNSLNLAGNNLKTLPIEITNLNSLTFLDIRRNQLCNLPVTLEAFLDQFILGWDTLV